MLHPKIFESTGWNLHDPEHDPSAYNKLIENFRNLRIVKAPPKPDYDLENENLEVKILQQYQFSSALQRMSVISQRSDSNKFMAFTKGSPEMIVSLSKPENVPHNIFKTLKKFTKKGYRVIAFGCKEIIAEENEVLIIISIEHVCREGYTRVGLGGCNNKRATCSMMFIVFLNH